MLFSLWLYIVSDRPTWLILKRANRRNMTIIELPDEQAAALRAKAAAQGMSLEDWFQALVSDPQDRVTLTPGEERARAFEQWASSHRSTPPLSDEAVSRASLIRDSR